MDASTFRTLPHHPRSMLVLRENRFVCWLGKARPGDRIRYHAGHLATDRVCRLSQLSEARCRELAAIADRASPSPRKAGCCSSRSGRVPAITAISPSCRSAPPSGWQSHSRP